MSTNLFPENFDSEALFEFLSSQGLDLELLNSVTIDTKQISDAEFNSLPAITLFASCSPPCFLVGRNGNYRCKCP